MYFVKTPRFIQKLFPRFIWRKETEENIIHLTFDDGPEPEITSWVLEQLQKYNAKATFFCLGKNADKHPEWLTKIQKSGHSIGHHTYSHLDAWKTDNNTYFKDVKKGAALIKTRLFRPPYGRLKPSQISYLLAKYQIVMWDLMCGDFDARISKEECWNNIIKNTTKGSILVLHDNLKSKEKLMYVLPKILEHFTQLGYRFYSITN